MRFKLRVEHAVIWNNLRIQCLSMAEASMKMSVPSALAKSSSGSRAAVVIPSAQWPFICAGNG
jgi:hypothetical protein